jgi:DeoR/GlpR family transcriptional regulator of sugar metabolism
MLNCRNFKMDGARVDKPASGMRYRSAPDRRTRLLGIVEEQGFSSTNELMAALGVSDMTVRRDAQKLADKGQVRMVHGGVSVLQASDLEGSGEFDVRAALMATAKRAVGRAAASRISEGQVIAIDAGTTARELARSLPIVTPLTVITHSAPVIADLMARPSTSLIALGGELHPETLSFDGPFVLRAISELQIDTFYLAASGVGPRGVFCANDFDAVTKRALIAIASRVVLIIDSSKFHAPAMVRVCNLSEVQEIIVDDDLSDEDHLMLTRAGVEITAVSLQ